MIDQQRLQVAEIRESAASITVSSDGMPRAEKRGSKTERTVENVETEEERLRHLERQLYQMIVSIPDRYIRKMIRLKICKNWTWEKISWTLGGSNSGDSIRKLCVRYHW